MEEEEKAEEKMSHTPLLSALCLKVWPEREHFVLLDVSDAVGPLLPLQVQVSVRERHQPPAHGEQQPAADEGGGEDDEGVAPLEVHQRGEHVLQEAALFADVLVRQVAWAVLGDEARLVDPVSEHRLSGNAGDEPRQAELLRDDAFPRQHPVGDDGGTESKVFSASSARLYARMAQCPPAEDRWGARRLGCAPPPLRSSEGWDSLQAPVDVGELPESRPDQTQVLLPSWAIGKKRLCSHKCGLNCIFYLNKCFLKNYVIIP